MAQRLSSDERARIEAMRAAGVSVEETARRLGRHRSTVYRELVRNSTHGRYNAQAAQAAARAAAVLGVVVLRERLRPNGQGLTYPSVADDTDVGISPNELTSEEDRDWFAGTPWHKHVRARLEKV